MSISHPVAGQFSRRGEMTDADKVNPGTNDLRHMLGAIWQTS